MTPEAAKRYAKAMRFLEQANRHSPGEAPESTIHVSYCAMLHAAAAAVLLDRTGEVAKSHSGVIGQFSRLIPNDDERGRSFGRAFNNAEQLRLFSDYEDSAVPTAEEAAELRTQAADFVAYCRSLLAP
jgi:uncharacterized protein (UPF0332 family)